MSQNRETLQIPRSASNLFPKSECRAPGLVLVRQAPVHSSSSKIKHFYSFEVSFISSQISFYLFISVSAGGCSHPGPDSEDQY